VLDLVVHCHDFQTFSSGPRFAAGLAAALGASLTGLYVTPRLRPLPPADAPASLTSEFLDFVRAEMERAPAARATFGRLAEAAGVDIWHWQTAVGSLVDCIAATGNWNDIVVLEHRERVPKYCTETIAGTVLGGSPCLVVREAALSVPARLQRVAIAWNGSMEAIRAVHAALPILQRARQIHVLSSPPVPRGSAVICEPEFALERYLRQHGCAPQAVTLRLQSRSVGEAILVTSAEVGADLLVMGAYGSEGVRPGDRRGLTNYIIEQCTLPLFLRH
jgi:nucleotide-binding universal stress UspA family protein